MDKSLSMPSRTTFPDRLRQRLFIIGIMLGMFLGTPGVASAQELTFIYPVRPNALYDAARQILREVYFKLGYGLDFAFVYGDRGLVDSAAGRADGELARVAGVERDFPALLKIPVSHIATQQMAFARDKSIKVRNWRSLMPYKIVLDKGDEIAEQNTRNMKRFLASSEVVALKMVENRKMDIAIADRFNGLNALEKLGFDDVHMLQPAIQVVPLYHYVNRKHAKLLSRITFVMRSMQTSGRMNEILEEHGIGPPAK